MSLRRLLPCLVVLAACEKNGGLEVEVRFQGFRPGCLEVTAEDRLDLAHRGTSTFTVTEARPHHVAIAMAKGWSRSWSISVVAREASCTGAIVAQTRDDAVEIPKGPPKVQVYELTAADGDGDGFVSRDGGGTDCDDGEPRAAPGLAETCADGIDNDCQNGADCDDLAACDGQGCGAASLPCRADAGTCSAGACSWPLLPVTTACGPGLACNNSGACVPADGELDCANGLDDDHDDAGFDCADTDCDTYACDAGRCVTGAVCGSGVCGGAMVTCLTPSTCRDAGACNPATGACDYPTSPAGATCATDPCLQSETCNGAGVCGGGAPRVCPGSGPCLAGTCDAGGCALAALSTGPCDDDAGCTHTDTCLNGVCGGTLYACGPAPACRMSGVCSGDGGCGFVADLVQNGLACGDGGVCSVGQCLEFPYDVSNVDPATLPPVAARVIINCPVTFDSTDGGVTGSWCGSPAPNLTFVTQQGSSEPAAVLSMRALDITADGGSLRLVGTRPVILLVFDKGATEIDGTIDARSLLAVAGAGGDRPSCGLQAGGTGTASLRPTEEVGAGGGGGGLLTRGGWGGNSVWTVSVVGADGGIAGSAAREPLVGGCGGGRGGLTNHPPLTPCNGGAGGGALQISVAGLLRVGPAAVITVSGGGGSAPPQTTGHGGCGGGSGGVLLLEGVALNLQAGAWLTANGGAGSEGADYQATTPDRGDDGAAASELPAAGGTGGAAYAGPGGNGGAGTTDPTTPGPDYVGGGGGGAAGRIHLRAQGACVHLASFSPTIAADAGCP